MNKNTIFLFLLISVIWTTSFAQSNTSIGLKAGVNFTGFHTGKSVYTGDFGINAGVTLDWKILDFLSIQPELIFNQKAGGYKISEPNANYHQVSRLNYIDVPLMLKIKVLKKMNIQLGPQAGILLSEKSKYSSYNTPMKTNSLDYAVNGGFGFKVAEDFFAQARYSYGLSEIFKDRKYKNSVISLSVGYLIKN